MFTTPDELCTSCCEDEKDAVVSLHWDPGTLQRTVIDNFNVAAVSCGPVSLYDQTASQPRLLSVIEYVQADVNNGQGPNLQNFVKCTYENVTRVTNSFVNVS